MSRKKPASPWARPERTEDAVSVLLGTAIVTVSFPNGNLRNAAPLLAVRVQEKKREPSADNDFEPGR